jgi:GT2 family glycosyltransferase
VNSVLPGQIYIVLLNWNGWRDTIECLESVYRNTYPNYQVIVCDNNSRDDSLKQIREWADGRRAAPFSDSNTLQTLSYPPVPKPVSRVEFDRAEAEAGGSAAGTNARLILIQTGANLGFAGGNNVGLRYALQRDDYAYIWLLNNDTVIKPDALTHLVTRMQEIPDAGMCGSTLPFYQDPRKIWALGGATYNKWLAMPHCIGLLQSKEAAVDPQQVERRLAYIAGASILVSRDFLRDIGLLSENYFLYFEELDWAVRSRGRYRLAYAPKSIVYHKVAASTVMNLDDKDTSVADYFMFRNSLLFTYKYFPVALPLVLPRVSIIFLMKKIRSVFRKRLRSTHGKF